MNQKTISPKTHAIILKMQQTEENASAIYFKIASQVKDQNKAIIEQIAKDEAQHALVWSKYTKKKLKPNRFYVFWVSLLAKLLGFTFIVKFLEKGEVSGILTYQSIMDEIPEVSRIVSEETDHENKLMGMLNEERLKYVGSMVLGMNDALIELTGALAGFTFAMQNTRIVALAGLITGVSATLSMTSSSYLSSKADGDPDALKSSLYTGAMYLVTVALMVFPYLIVPNSMPLVALGIMLAIVILIIFGFNFYIAIAKDLHFKSRFLEMLILAILVTGVSFAIGTVFKSILNIDIL